MGRIRTVKPEFNAHEGLSALSCQAHLMAEALLCYADDEGYFNANPGLVRAGTCPLREDFGNIPGLLRELSGMGYLRLGDGASGKRYGHIVHFKDYQRVSHPYPSKIKEERISWEDSGNVPETSGISAEQAVNATEPLRPEREKEKEKEKEGNSDGGKALPDFQNNTATGIDANMMARGLCERLNLSRGMGKGTVYEAVYDLAMQAEKRGSDLEILCMRMESAYRQWMDATDLEYRWGVAKFFAEGYWRDPSTWPRKQQKQTQPKPRILSRPGGQS